MFQDFNKEVLEKITFEYINQLPIQNKAEDIGKLSPFAFMDGDWSAFSEKLKLG